MKKILIVGGGGYVGTELTQKLLKNNYVTVYDLFYFDWLIKTKIRLKIQKDFSQLKRIY